LLFNIQNCEWNWLYFKKLQFPEILVSCISISFKCLWTFIRRIWSSVVETFSMSKLILSNIFFWFSQLKNKQGLAEHLRHCYPGLKFSFSSFFILTLLSLSYESNNSTTSSLISASHNKVMFLSSRLKLFVHIEFLYISNNYSTFFTFKIKLLCNSLKIYSPATVCIFIPFI